MVFDVVCGSGCNLCWLVEVGWCVIGIDCDMVVIVLLCVQVEIVDVDIENGFWFLVGVIVCDFDFVVVCNYLWWLLFEFIKLVVKFGGWLIWEMFVDGQQIIGWFLWFDFLLQWGELLWVCGDWYIVVYEDLFEVGVNLCFVQCVVVVWF